jgi:hypothetical protein
MEAESVRIIAGFVAAGLLTLVVLLTCGIRDPEPLDAYEADQPDEGHPIPRKADPRQQT